MGLDGGASHTRAPCGPPIRSTYRPTVTSTVNAPDDEGVSDVITQMIAGTAVELSPAQFCAIGRQS